MSEYTEVTDKLSELRQQKQKLSRTVRDKEEVMEDTLKYQICVKQDFTLTFQSQDFALLCVEICVKFHVTYLLLVWYCYEMVDGSLKAETHIYNLLDLEQQHQGPIC